MNLPLSVILPVYYRNDAAQLKSALQSILTQTRLPEEVLVVTDGPVPAELEQVIHNAQFTMRNFRWKLLIFHGRRTKDWGKR